MEARRQRGRRGAAQIFFDVTVRSSAEDPVSYTSGDGLDGPSCARPQLRVQRWSPKTCSWQTMPLPCSGDCLAPSKTCWLAPRARRRVPWDVLSGAASQPLQWIRLALVVDETTSATSAAVAIHRLAPRSARVLQRADAETPPKR